MTPVKDITWKRGDYLPGISTTSVWATYTVDRINSPQWAIYSVKDFLRIRPVKPRTRRFWDKMKFAVSFSVAVSSHIRVKLRLWLGLKTIEVKNYTIVAVTIAILWELSFSLR